MFIFVLVIATGAVCSAQDFESQSGRTIKVMASLSEPFVILDEKLSTLRGLDVDIINNFAKKYNLVVEFVIANESLNLAFSSDNELGNKLARRIFDS